MNSLAKRIKAAKLELTALKTAHERGLGLLKIYSQMFDLPYEGHETGFWKVSITVNFDKRFGAYPMAYMLPTSTGQGDSFEMSIEQDAMVYTNNGRTAIIGAIFYYDTPDTAKYAIVSTAPIESIAYEWSKYI